MQCNETQNVALEARLISVYFNVWHLCEDLYSRQLDGTADGVGTCKRIAHMATIAVKNCTMF